MELSKLMQIVENLNWNPNEFITTLWVEEELPIYAGGLETFVNNNGLWETIPLNSSSVPLKIRGLKLNDVFIVGASGLLIHFNGLNWYKINDQALEGANLLSISLSNHSLIIGGVFQQKGKVIIGRW